MKTKSKFLEKKKNKKKQFPSPCCHRVRYYPPQLTTVPPSLPPLSPFILFHTVGARTQDVARDSERGKYEERQQHYGQIIIIIL